MEVMHYHLSVTDGERRWEMIYSKWLGVFEV